METERVYIGEVEALEIAQERNIDELPTLNHSIVSALSNQEEKETGFSCRNLGKDGKGFFLSENISYRKFS